VLMLRELQLHRPLTGDGGGRVAGHGPKRSGTTATSSDSSKLSLRLRRRRSCCDGQSLRNGLSLHRFNMGFSKLDEEQDKRRVRVNSTVVRFAASTPPHQEIDRGPRKPTQATRCWSAYRDGTAQESLPDACIHRQAAARPRHTGFVRSGMLSGSKNARMQRRQLASGHCLSRSSS
jgi:hypothetical protein